MRKVDITECKYNYTCAGTVLHKKPGGDTKAVMQKPHYYPSGMPSSAEDYTKPEET